MPVRLSTTVSKIASLSNTTNATLISEFYQYMKNNGASESHTNNSLKTNMAFAKFLGPDVTFYDIQRKEEIIAFLDTKIKGLELLLLFLKAAASIDFKSICFMYISPRALSRIYLQRSP